MKAGFKTLLFALSLTAPFNAWAAKDALVEGARLCTKHLSRYERENAIPTHLLSAIATTESGRYHQGLKLRLPWPWTINANGKGYYFDSKDEALAAARKFRAQGIKSMDVGCMQINLYHHPEAFNSLDSAFDPETNIAFAASFLRQLYTESGAWKQAAANYHSKTPFLGNKYVGSVYDSWFNIIDKLRAARIQLPENRVFAENTPVAKVVPVPKSGAEASSEAGNTVKPLPEQRGKKVQNYKSPHMNSIQVVNSNSRSITTGKKENGVTVIRPEILLADNSTVLTPVPVATLQNVKPVSKVIPVAEGSPASTKPARKNGPNFIFDN